MSLRPDCQTRSTIDGLMLACLLLASKQAARKPEIKHAIRTSNPEGRRRLAASGIETTTEST
jgi:hypothetical protein